MVDWLSYAARDPISGVGSAPYESEARPTWKLLLHTTEGATYAAARSAYRSGGYAPHLTVGPDPDRPGRVKAWQHLSFASRATTLADRSGGIRPNRDYVLQAEIVGFCDPKWKSHQLYIHNWPTWYRQGVAAVLRDMRTAKPIPRHSSVRWVAYPDSYGLNAAQRLSSSAFDAYSGILGHQHAPENCVHPDTPILCADLVWRRAGDLNVGQELVGFDEDLQELGSTGGRRYRQTIVTRNEPARADCYRVVTTQGEVIATADHPWLVRMPYVLRGRRVVWKHTNELVPEKDRIISVGEPWEQEQSYSAGWMAGVLDADGHAFAGGRHGSWVGFGQVDGHVLDMFLAECDRRGYRTKVLRRDWTERKKHLAAEPKDFTDIRILGGMWESLRVLGTLRPIRLFAAAQKMWDGAVVGKTTGDVAVLRVEHVGDQEIASLSTSTQTYIANGLLCHNTHGDPGNLGDFVRDYLLSEEEDMPTFRHYGLRKAMAIPPIDGKGAAHPRALLFDTEWADPSPASHGDGGSSYTRKASDGWTIHELSGLRVEGMRAGDEYQVQIVILDAAGDDILWSSVVEDAVTTSGKEHLSVVRSLRSRRNQRVRWRVVYLGKERDVKVTRADWILREY